MQKETTSLRRCYRKKSFVTPYVRSNTETKQTTKHI